MKILIAGGGIAGFTSALCLARHGHDVTIIERAPNFEEVGAGLQISPNGVKVLRALGLEDACRKVAFEPERLEMRFGKSGQTIFDIPLKEYAQKRWGAPYFHMHRADLLGALLTAANNTPGIKLCTSACVTGFKNGEDGVQVMLTKGETISGDLLVGSDGLHSVVRKTVIETDQPRYSGCIAWRGVVDIEKTPFHTAPPTACAWVGRGKHAVTYRLRGGRLINFVGVVEQDVYEDEDWSLEGARSQIKKDFSDWHPTIREIIEQGEAFFKWGLFIRDPLESWCNDRSVIIGDAAHPMLPFLAQGAVMAIEDAWVLAECLSAQNDLTSALKSFRTKRFERTRRVQHQSIENASTFHHRSDLMRLGVYGPMWMAGRVIPKYVHSRMDWLYGHDVTA